MKLIRKPDAPFQHFHMELVVTVNSDKVIVYRSVFFISKCMNLHGVDTDTGDILQDKLEIHQGLVGILLPCFGRHYRTGKQACGALTHRPGDVQLIEPAYAPASDTASAPSRFPRTVHKTSTVP